MRAPPPRDVEELLARARDLAGRTLREIAARIGARDLGDGGVRTKGKAGDLVERALGATGGSAAAHDFPHLGVELKTIPVDENGHAVESTYVCTVPIADAEEAEWATSWARAKLARVLWVPLVGTGALTDRRVGAPLLWSPTPEQDAVLRIDFEEAMGAIAIGHVEALTAHAGRWLQVRPKAKDGRARTIVTGPLGEQVPTVPRGFYLRARFTEAILRDPAATPLTG